MLRRLRRRNRNRLISPDHFSRKASMDILLAHGYFLAEDPKEQQIMMPYPPLGILSISAYLKQRGFRAGVFDGTFSERRAFAEALQSHRPAVVGFYANMMTRRTVLPMLRQARAAGCAVVVGGPDPPYYAGNYLRAGADVVVFGEGEQALEELIPVLASGKRAALAGIPGIAFLDDTGAVQKTPPRPFLPDLDALPWPDRQAIDLPRYLTAWKQHHGTSSVSLVTSRGCPYFCTWCSHSVYGHSLRKRSPENVAAEVEHIIATYNPDMLWYADDVFNIQPRWLRQFADALRKRHIAIPFECICRADRLNEEMIRLLRSMGCTRMWIGSESGSQRLLDKMKRGVKAEQVQAMTRLARRHGIETGMFLMWGFEDESPADIAATVEHVKKALPDRVLTTVAYPIKGTVFYHSLEKQGLLDEPADWASSSDRDIRIRGQRSRRYYYFASRWLLAELSLARQRSGARRSLLRRCKQRLLARFSRLAMWFCR